MWHDPITRYTLGLSAMLVLYWLCKRFVLAPLVEKGKLSKENERLLGTAVLYLPGLVLLWLLIKDLPISPLPRQNFTVANYVVVFAAQFFAFPLMGLFSILEIRLGLVNLKVLQKERTRGGSIVNILLLFALVPFLEELLCRKILGDILGSDHLRLFIYISALIFSLMHMQTGRLSVTVGMLYTGFLWAWVYAAGGSLLLSAAYHIIFNLMVVLVPDLLEKLPSQKAHGLYLVGLAVAGITGFIFLLTNLARYFPTEVFATQSPWQRIFGNWGFWVLTALCVFSYLLGLWEMKAKARSL